MTTTGGFLSLHGSLEATPEAKVAHLAEVLVEDLRLDYCTSDATHELEAEHAQQALELTRSVRNAPSLVLQVDTLKLTNGQLGFVNEATQPPYRLFVSGMDLELENLSNQAAIGRSRFQGRGAFMGSGAMAVSGGFLSTARTADFAVQLQLDHADLVRLNPFLLAYTKVDVAAGQLSLYTEMTVKDGRVDGYVKPLFKDLRISDPVKDRAKPFGKRVEMHVLQFLAGRLKNRTSGEVATVTTVSGSTLHPRAGEWEAIRKLIGNGLVHAILPGFLVEPPGKGAKLPVKR
jgi:hypothetical protein